MAPAPAPLAFQYAAKFICAKAAEPGVVMPGYYTTTVNVHNPTNQDLEYRFKFARANRLADGPIVGFKDNKIGPDGAQYFDCAFIRELAHIPPGEVVDGFLVIECKTSLDVVAVYTTSSTDLKGVPTIEVERVFERRTG